MELKHDLDVHAHMRLNPENMAREFMLTKNRFGPAGIPYECNLTARGLDFATLKETEVKPENGGSPATGKAGERREQVKKLIKEALLRGEKVSGYCLARFPDPFTKKMGVECSGGFWRSILDKAVYDLKANGSIIGEAKIDGRTHFYVEMT
jgi:hypothetical protein